jgi:catecholate siderophore receptor
VPRHAATWWNKVQLPGAWSVGLGLIAQSSTYASTTNAVLLPAFTRADAAVYYTFGKQNRLSLNVENILDRHYTPTAGNDYNITEGTPRKVQLTMSCRF